MNGTANDSTSVRRFVCLACGYAHLKWSARCSRCLKTEGLEARTLAEIDGNGDPVPMEQRLDGPREFPKPRLVIAPPPSPEPELSDPVAELVDLGPSGPVPISDITEETFVRDSTGLAPLDHVLGGGLVATSVVLLAALPGCGKSSLALQMLVGLRHRCLYVTGEQTREELAATARRIGAVSNRLYVLAERSLSKIVAHARTMRAQTIVIDSIQKMTCEDVSGRAGSPSQLKECTARLVDHAKTTGTAVWLIGHVTADGDIAGPKTIEHDVDIVLELSQGAGFEGNERILRCNKNRFGSSNHVGRFELTAGGLVPVDADGWNENL